VAHVSHDGPARGGPTPCEARGAHQRWAHTDVQPKKGAGAKHRRRGTVDGKYFAPLAPGTEAPSWRWKKRNAPPAPPGAMLDRAGGARDTGVSARAKMSVYFARPTACFHRPTLGAGGAGGRSSRKRKAAVSATGQMSVIFANTGIGYFTFNLFLPREHGNVEATGGSC